MTQYQRKPEVFDARQWDGTQEGFAALQSFGPVGIAFSSDSFTVYVPIESGVYMQPNDWLFRDYFGIFSVVRADDFSNLFEAV